MPSPLTQTAAQAILARDTTEVLLDCVVISGPGLGPYRFVQNNESLVRAEGTFYPADFLPDLPEDSDNGAGGMTLRFDNVDRSLLRLLREYDDVPEVRVETVLASDPDTIVSGPFEFSVLHVEPDLLYLTITCGTEEDFLNQAVPAQSTNPVNSPALYA